MALLCYTTSVAADKTAAQITHLLSRHGARSLLIDYDGARNPSGIAFEIATSKGDRQFQLPINPEAVGRVLRRQFTDRKLAGISLSKAGDPEHARRVAWRINLEWVRVQLALIESEMATLEQIFLPYMILNGRTVYEIVEGQGMKMLPAPEEKP